MAVVSSVLDSLDWCSGTSAFKGSCLFSLGLLLLPILAVARSAVFIWWLLFNNFRVWNLAPRLYKVKKKGNRGHSNLSQLFKGITCLGKAKPFSSSVENIKIFLSG